MCVFLFLFFFTPSSEETSQIIHPPLLTDITDWNHNVREQRGPWRYCVLWHSAEKRAARSKYSNDFNLEPVLKRLLICGHHCHVSERPKCNQGDAFDAKKMCHANKWPKVSWSGMILIPVGSQSFQNIWKLPLSRSSPANVWVIGVSQVTIVLWHVFVECLFVQFCPLHPVFIKSFWIRPV